MSTQPVLSKEVRAFLADAERTHRRWRKECAPIKAEIARIDAEGPVYATPWQCSYLCNDCGRGLTYHQVIASRGICPLCRAEAPGGPSDDNWVNHSIQPYRDFLRPLTAWQRVLCFLTLRWYDAAYGYVPVYRQHLRDGDSPFKEPSVEELAIALTTRW